MYTDDLRESLKSKEICIQTILNREYILFHEKFKWHRVSQRIFSITVKYSLQKLPSQNIHQKENINYN